MRFFSALVLTIFTPSILFASTSEHHHVAAVNPLIIIPFAVLLLSIAIVPLVNKHWWEEKYPIFAYTLGAIVVAYYLFFLNDAISLMHTGLEYVSFVSLVGSLYVITGCIYLQVDKKSSPKLNCALLLFGAVFANIVGTTGASAFLIRSYIKINRARFKAYHMVFFIFIVSNVGGVLTPIGDPPLFLGYLKGVPFFWTLANVWHIWIFAIVALLFIFYLIDRKNMPDDAAAEDQHYSDKISVDGKRGFVYLGVVLAAVLLPSFIQEIVGLPVSLLLSASIMLLSGFAAYKGCKKEILVANEFDFEPIREVAILFLGIFSCMIPALQWLSQNASSLGISSMGQFYWGTGVLSGVLDNAPTYLNFLSAAFGISDMEMGSDMGRFIVEHGHLLQAISVGAVFFGAMTYIGNAPNFMIKSICEQAGVEVPSFIGYIGKYSVPILLPLFVVVWLLFFF